MRCLELETSRLLLLRDGDCGEECFLGGPGVRRIALEQNLAADAMKEGGGPIWADLFRQRQRLADCAGSAG